MNKLTIIGFASTRSVQIAAAKHRAPKQRRFFASTRSVQIVAAEMHRMHMHFLERVLSW